MLKDCKVTAMRPFKRRHRPHIDYWHVPDRDDCEFEIVGESFHKYQIDTLLKDGRKFVESYGDWKKLGVQFWLVRDIHNQHDKNAIAVYASLTDRYDHTTALQVGSLDRQTAATYASHIVQPVPVKGIIIGKNDHFGVRLNPTDMAAGGLL